MQVQQAVGQVSTRSVRHINRMQMRNRCCRMPSRSGHIGAAALPLHQQMAAQEQQQPQQQQQPAAPPAASREKFSHR